MNEKDSNMTVVFIGYDGYSDIWDDCIRLYQRFWSDNPYRTIFVNNEKEVEWDGIEVLHAGKEAEWSRKVQCALKACETKYICLLLEDFLIGKTINTTSVKNTVEFIKREKIRYFKLTNMSRVMKNHDPNYGGYKFLHIIPESDDYGVSLQPAIWRRDYLVELLGEENYNAWIFEFNRVKDSENKSNTPNPGCIIDDRNILNLQHGVMQSKYLPGTVKYFETIGIKLNVEREVMSPVQHFRMQAISVGKELIPRPFRKGIKKILEKLGMKFVSTIRSE